MAGTAATARSVGLRAADLNATAGPRPRQVGGRACAARAAKPAPSLVPEIDTAPVVPVAPAIDDASADAPVIPVDDAPPAVPVPQVY